MTSCGPLRVGGCTISTTRDAVRLPAGVRLLERPSEVRRRAAELLARTEAGDSHWFTLDESRLDAVAERVVKVTSRNYPSLEVPYHSRWRHFEVAGRSHWEAIARKAFASDAAALGRAAFDLVIPSVLLDAGSGGQWRYIDSESGQVFERSEGLALASLTLFLDGAFSATRHAPMRSDAAALRGFDADALRRGFQVTRANPLAGVAGRVALLRSLGEAVRTNPVYFGADEPRVGGLFDYLSIQAKGGELKAEVILATVLDAFRAIWPRREQIAGVDLGDVWRHSAIVRTDESTGLVPFHKLSQWLSYSLVEPLEATGIRVVGIDELTGLAEYRNGGLFVDSGALAVRPSVDLGTGYAPGSEFIVEWRALTVALLDRLLPLVRDALSLGPGAFPLAKLLQGGTWSAGRQLAREKRADASPPIRIDSDGTVF